jgi:predicted nucleic acid-binding protein
MQIKDNSFLDSNILIYYFSKDNTKLETTKEIIYSDRELIISTQVINEFINVGFKKLNLNTKDIKDKFETIKRRFSIKYLDESTIEKALELKNIYRYSFYDSLILSSALENNCETIYSEDFNHNQLIEGKLKIINPFK